MPKVGLSRPYASIYSSDGVGGTTYSKGARAGRAVEYALSVESGSDSDFYCDNATGETAGGVFSGGELSITVAELDSAISALILGAKRETMTVDGQEVSTLVFDDDMQAPNMGFGIIVKSIVWGETKWRAVVLTKVKFNIPGDAAITQAESIEWQTDAITARVMRDDTEKHRWRIDAEFDSEAKADAFICHMLKIKNASLDTLTVNSAAGSAAGKTAVTVSPPIGEGRTYKYKTGENLTLPKLYQDLSSWTAWDGTAEISAATGGKIVIAEVDTAGLAMAAGIATVTSKEA